MYWTRSCFENHANASATWWQVCENFFLLTYTSSSYQKRCQVMSIYLSSQKRWYDFKVTCKLVVSFLIRFGHINDVISRCYAVFEQHVLHLKSAEHLYDNKLRAVVRGMASFCPVYLGAERDLRFTYCAGRMPLNASLDHFGFDHGCVFSLGPRSCMDVVNDMLHLSSSPSPRCTRPPVIVGCSLVLLFGSPILCGSWGQVMDQAFTIYPLLSSWSEGGWQFCIWGWWGWWEGSRYLCIFEWLERHGRGKGCRLRAKLSGGAPSEMSRCWLARFFTSRSFPVLSHPLLLCGRLSR